MTRHWFAPLVIVAALFFLSPREWWPVLVYTVTAVAMLTMCATRLVRWWQIQRDSSVLVLAVVNLFQAVALIMGALIAAPHPVYDLRPILTPYARLAWAAALPFFLVAVHTEMWWVLNVIFRRQATEQHDN